MGKRTNTAKWMENQKRWQINVQKDGVRRSFTSSKPGRTGQREANAKADAWLDDGIAGQSLRVSASLDLYIESKTGTVSDGTIRSEKSKIDTWINPNIGRKKLSSLTEGDLQRILDAAGKKGLSKKSISNIRAVVMQWLKFCRKNKLTTLNPEFLEIPRGAKQKGKRILQPEDIRKLFKCDTTAMYGKTVFDDYINAYRFSVLTGVRPGELLGLRWDDIVGDMVHIKRSINKDGVTTTGKNQNALRSFVLTDIAKEVIDSQRRISRSDSVFEIESQSTYRHRWERYCKSNGIAFVSLYELRHTFVSIAKSLPDGELRQLVGHSRSMDTYGIYSHELNADKEKTAKKLNKIIESVL